MGRKRYFTILSLIVFCFSLEVIVVSAFEDALRFYDELDYSAGGIILEFSSQIVPLSDYESMISNVSNKVLIEFSPSISYKWSYISPSKFEIVFLEKPKPFSFYSLKIKNISSIKDINNNNVVVKIKGNEIKDEYRFVIGEFGVEDIQLVSLKKVKDSFEAIANITFNSTPDIESLKDKISIISGNNIIRDFSVEFSTESSNNVLVKIIGLGNGRKYDIIVDKGVKVRYGDVVSRKKFEYSFIVPDKLKLNDVKRDIDYYNNTYYITLSFNNEFGDLDIGKYIEIEEKVNNIDIVVDGKYVYIYGDFEPNKYYTVVVSKDTRDIYGQSLGQDIKEKVYIEEVIYSRFSGPYGVFVLENYLPLILPTGVRNLKGININYTFASNIEDVKKILEGSRDLTNSYYIDLEKLKLNKRIFYQYQVNLSKILGVSEKSKVSGIFIYEMEGVPIEYPFEEYHLRKGGVALITSMGITVKKSPFRIAVFVRYLGDNSPVENAEVYGIKDNEIKLIGKTDKNGVLFVKGDGYSFSWFIAKKGDEITCDIGGYNYYEDESEYEDSYYYEDYGYGGINFGLREGVEKHGYRDNVREVKVSLFTEKYLYKPGEKVYVKGIARVRNNDKWDVFNKTNIYFDVYNSRDEKITNLVIPIDDMGGFDFTIDVDRGSPTGYYRIVSRDFDYINEYFRVEDFKPSIAEINIIPKKTKFVWGEVFESDIIGKYLFGAPLSGEVSVNVYVSPMRFSSRKFPDYVFYYSHDGSFDFISKEVNLDELGKVKVSKLLEEEGFIGNARIRITASATLEDKSVVSGMRNDVLVLNPYNVGIKLDRYFASAGDTINIKLVAVDSDDNITNNIPVKVEIYGKMWVSYQEAGVNGRLEWKWKEIEDVVLKTNITVGNTTVPFQIKDPGYYIVKVYYRVRDNELMVSDDFYCIGEKAYWYYGDDTSVDLRLDKQNYKVGDVAKLLILNPFKSATAIITVEREDIHKIIVVEIKEGMKVVPIKIEEDFAPNAFISVVLHSGREGKNNIKNGVDLVKPKMKIGYIEINVDDPGKKLKMVVNTSKSTYEPREEVKGEIFVSDSSGKPVNGEAVIAVVDKGVLNLVNYKLPDLYNFFYSRRELAVSTIDMRRVIYGQRYLEEKGEVIGGDGDYEESEGIGSIGEQNVENIRKDIRGTAYYVGKAKINGGVCKFNFNLPDNLTTFKIMVVGYTEDSKFGYVEKDIVINKSLMVVSSFPMFVRMGDKVKGSVIVFNYTGKSDNVNVFVKPNGPFKFGYLSTNVYIKDGGSSEVLFDFEVGKTSFGIYDYNVIIGAKLESFSDALEVELPVYNPLVYSVVGVSGRSDKNFDITLSPSYLVYPEYSKIFVSVSPSAFSELKGGLDYLIQYPYGCLEQKSSQVFPLVLGEEIIVKRKLLDYKTRDDLRKVVQDFINEVPSYYVKGKGFDYWPGSSSASAYITAYAMLFLTKAKEMGYKIDEKIYSEVLDILKSFTKGGEEFSDLYHYGDMYKLLTTSMAFYILALNKVYDVERIKSFYYSVKDKSDITVMANILKAVSKYPDFKEKTEIINQIKKLFTMKIKEDVNFAYFDSGDWGYFYYDDVIVSAIVLQSLLEAGIKFDSDYKIVKWIISQKKYNGAWYNTHENAMAFWALTEYLRSYESEKPNFSVKVLANTYEVLSSVFKEYIDPEAKKEILYDTKIASVGVGGKIGDIKLSFLKEGRKWNNVLHYQVLLSFR